MGFVWPTFGGDKLGSTPPTHREENPGLRIFLAGDVMLGRGIDQVLRHSVDPVLYESYVRSAETYVELAEGRSGPIPRDVAPGYVWGDLLDVLRSSGPSVRIVNLETALTTAGEPWPRKGIHYRSHPANADVLLAAGIDVAVLANNHVLDWGRPGLEQTLDALREAGVASAGAGSDLSSASGPAVIPLPGGRLLVFAAAHESSGVPETWSATGSRSGVFLIEALSPAMARKMAAEIKGFRQPGDRVVVSVHWGGNWGCAVPPDQERFARALIDEGAADLVFGHSSHHPKGIEVYRDRLILYGAGDLINDYEGIGGHEEFRPGLALAYLPRLDASGLLLSMEVVPFRIERFRLRRAASEETAWLRHLLARESRGVTVALSPDRTIQVLPSRN